MENLGQIPAIKQKIHAASRAVIVTMHKFIFKEEGDRNNRRRLCEFRGFEFNDASPEFGAKLQYAVGFTIGDLRFAISLALYIWKMPNNCERG